MLIFTECLGEVYSHATEHILIPLYVFSHHCTVWARCILISLTFSRITECLSEVYPFTTVRISHTTEHILIPLYVFSRRCTVWARCISTRRYKSPTVEARRGVSTNQRTYSHNTVVFARGVSSYERWGAGVETQKNVRGLGDGVEYHLMSPTRRC